MVVSNLAKRMQISIKCVSKRHVDVNLSSSGLLFYIEWIGEGVSSLDGFVNSPDIVSPGMDVCSKLYSR